MLGHGYRRFRFSPRRDAAAKRFFRKARAGPHTVNPRTITVDRDAAYPKAVAEMKWDKQLWRFSKLRRVKYLKKARSEGSAGTILSPKLPSLIRCSTWPPENGLNSGSFVQGKTSPETGSGGRYEPVPGTGNQLPCSLRTSKL